MLENKALVDNWTLELAASVLGEAILPRHSNTLMNEKVMCQQRAYVLQSYLELEEEISPSDIWTDFDRKLIGERININPITSVHYELAQSILHFLDLIIMYDTLVVDSEMAFTWERFESMKFISPMVSKVRLGDTTKVKIQSLFTDIQTKDDEVGVISQGALYYLGLANLLGLDYWAAPKRAEFLSEKLGGGYKKGFVSVLGNISDKELQSLTHGLLQNELLKGVKNSIYFPGFGASVLSKCNSRTEILEKAISFRQSKECTAFRAWLSEMCSATEEGNLKFLINNLNDIQTLIDNIKKEMGEHKFDGKVELEIGISPSLTIDSVKLNSIFEQYKPKKLHLSFLRHHFYRALENSNIWFHIWRLFPELRV